MHTVGLDLDGVVGVKRLDYVNLSKNRKCMTCHWWYRCRQQGACATDPACQGLSIVEARIYIKRGKLTFCHEFFDPDRWQLPLEKIEPRREKCCTTATDWGKRRIIYDLGGGLQIQSEEPRKLSKHCWTRAIRYLTR